MSESGRPASPGVTLCMVIHTRSGNLANALHSANRLAGQMVIVDAGGGGGSSVKHIASEYDAAYLQMPADPDESALLNAALDEVKSPWALFLHQQEVLHANDPQAVLDHLGNTEVIAFDFPIIRFNEPGNHYYETRLIRTDRQLRWDHTIFPSLTASLNRAAGEAMLKDPAALMPLAAIVSLGESAPEEWELRDAIIRLEQELDKNPQSTRYWYHLARTASELEEWDRAHSAVEEGLKVISKQLDTPHQDPQAVNGLIGMFCDFLLIGKYFPEKTVDSLWTIFSNMEGNGRFSVPLGHLLLELNREEDAIAAQLQAVNIFFHERRYYLTLEEGLFRPILLIWEIALRRTKEDLLRSVVEIQTLLNRHKYEMRPLLQYIHAKNQALFTAIQEILQKSLKKLD